MSEAQVIRELKEAFDRVYGGGDCRIFFAPGRVNLIGEHIDYNGGKSRNAKRIVYSNDGLIFYTGDHYESFSQLY